MIIVDSEKKGKNGKPRGIWIWVAAFLEAEVYEKFFVRHNDERCYTLLSHERCRHKQLKQHKFPREIYIVEYRSKACYRIMYSNLDTGEVESVSCKTGIATADWLNNRIALDQERRRFKNLNT